MGTTIIIIIVILLILTFIVKYNKIVSLKNKVKQTKSGIDVYLNQRFDLIPNLVECVKGYSEYEKDTIEKIIEMRSSYVSNKSNNIKDAENLNNGLNKLIALVENYPDLKASEQFLNLQKALTKMESQLQAARRIYNTAVTEYNTKINVVPNNIVAGMFGFKEESLFEIDDSKRENIKVSVK